MRLLQREKRPKRRTPPAQAAGLRALLLEPGFRVPRTLHLLVSARREAQSPLNRRTRRRATGGPAPGPSFWPPNLGPGDPAPGGAARRPWARKAAALSPEKASRGGRASGPQTRLSRDARNGTWATASAAAVAPLTPGSAGRPGHERRDLQDPSLRPRIAPPSAFKLSAARAHWLAVT